ncbi:MAG: hypothetical protein WC655_23615 [Candidatus Hydrogenedentales bacterium]|jgi:hypothetical protein
MKHAIMQRIRGYVLAEVADLWAMRQRRKMRRSMDKAEYLSAESFAFWMRKDQRERAQRRAE